MTISEEVKKRLFALDDDKNRRVVRDPKEVYDFLKKAGVAAIYGPGTNIPAAAAEILSILRQRGQKRAA